MTAERFQAHPADDEDSIVVPIKLGDALPSEQREPFPLVALWQRLDGPARAFVVALAVLFAGIGYTFGPGWAATVVGLAVLVDAWGFTFERRSDE